MDNSKILFFMIPKQKVICVYDDFNLQEVLDVMKSTRFSAIPVLGRNGKYVGTLSEGDILWHIKKIKGFSFDQASTIKISEIKRLRDNVPVDVNCNIEILIARSADENFVPVLDEEEQFVGIITRKEVITYFFDHKFVVL